MRQVFLLSVTPLSRLIHKETDGSPKFPDYPCRYMTWSQTPVVSCALVATWRTQFIIGNIHAILAHRTAAFHQIKSVGFLRQLADYPNDHNYTFFGAQYKPASLIPTASHQPLLISTCSSLLSCWLRFGQMGLFYFTCENRITHWAILSNFIPPVAEIPTIWI